MRAARPARAREGPFTTAHMSLLKFLLRLPGPLLALALLAAVTAALAPAVWAALRLGRAGLAAALVALAAAAGLGLWAVYRRRVDALVLMRVLLRLRASLPDLGARPPAGLFGGAVRLERDRFGVHTVHASTRADAFRALGFLSARDRLFQMDLGRREIAGRLSEVAGPATLGADLRKREAGFGRAADRILSGLPAPQRELLEAYAEGVNAFIGGAKSRPFEFLVLGYEPEPWAPRDSVLVMLRMFDLLTGNDEAERMMTVMRATLPAAVVEFLTPDADCYGEVLLGGPDSRHPARPTPVAEMSSLLAGREGAGRASPGLVETRGGVAGSNCWAVAGARTADGRAILASDVHLNLGVPNAFYRAGLRYEGLELSGVMMPGIPLILVGSNGRVAWGVTNLRGDCLDLVPLQINPDDEDEYLTPGGWVRFESACELVGVRGRAPVPAVFRHTVWGPVAGRHLMGRPVATQWTALEPGGVDFSLIEMDRAADVEEAVAVFNGFAGPPMNAVVADAGGRIAYTVCGRLPLRRGFEGSAALDRGGGEVGWEGYVPASELPRLFDPPSGYVVTANNRAWGADYPHVLGHDFSNGYRARRISERLGRTEGADEAAMFALQSDAACGFYEFYREVALDALGSAAASAAGGLEDLRRLIASWDGKAEVGSNGLVVLMGFREMLEKAVFAPFLEKCAEADEKFSYCWQNAETPLRAMLTERRPELLPDPETYADWDSFILGTLLESVGLIVGKYGAAPAGDFRWGRFNKAVILHPLGLVVPALRRLLSMPHDPLRGNPDCVCVSAPTFGSVARVVVSPGRHGDGLCVTPCGQSGHPLSPNYGDQQDYWVKHEPLPFAPGPAAHATVVGPSARGDS